MTRAAIYARISKDRDGEGLGVERQIEDCRALANRLGLEVVDTYVDNDLGASTKSRKPRPEYARMLSDVREGRISVILAYSNSRLTRRPREVEDLIELNERHGIRIHTVVSGDDDLSTADGRYVARIKGNADTAEAERTSERIKRKKLQARAEGKYHGGQRPFGYEIDGMTIREDEAAVVRHIATELLAGRSLGSLVREVNARGVATPERKRGEVTLAGKPWNQVSMRLMMLRARNAGLIEHNKEIVGKAQWEPLIPEDRWRAIVSLLKDPRRRTNFAGPEPKYLLSGIALCGVCGDRCVAVSSGNGRRAYSCRTTRGHVSRLQDRVDLLILGIMVERLRQGDVAGLLTRDRDAAAKAQVEKARATIAEQTALLKDLGVMFMRKQIAHEAIVAATAEAKAEIAKAQATIDAAVGGRDLSWLASAPDPAQEFLDAPLDKQRAVVDDLLEVRIVKAPRGRPPADSGRAADPRYVKTRWKHS